MGGMAENPRTGRRRPSPARGRARSRDQSPSGGSAARAHTISFGGLEISVRVLAVLILVGLVLVMVVPSLYQWWQQDQQYREISAQVTQAEQKNAQMQEQLDLWKDPTYIASQARERLGYAKPGETQYSVVDPDNDQQSGGEASTTTNEGPALPWVEVLSASLAQADNPKE